MRERATITVYRDDPIWNTGKRWFQLDQDRLAELHVITFEITGECVTVEDVTRHARDVARDYPDCILLHIG